MMLESFGKHLIASYGALPHTLARAPDYRLVADTSGVLCSGRQKKITKNLKMKI